MGILSGLFKARDVPQNRTVGSAYGFHIGRSAAGKRVTQRTSMQVTAVQACVRVLAESMASLPVHIYRYENGGKKEKATDHPLYFLLQKEPNDEMTSFNFREAMMSNILLWGNAYAQIVRNGRGDVVAIYPLMADRMEVSRDENGSIIYEYTTVTEDTPSVKRKTTVLRSDEVLHIPGLGFDGLIGYSPIAMARNAIGLGIAAEEFGSSFYANGASPSGVLEHPGTVKDPSKIRDAWTAAYGGSRNAHKVAVLEEGMKYTPISINPSEAQFLETRKFQIDEIARIFRVPPHMIGDLEKSTFSNIEQQSLDFGKYTLGPWVARWEQSLERSLFSRQEKMALEIKFNMDGLLRGDYQSRMGGYSVGIQNGFMSPNDCRALENMDPIPDELGGNSYMVNGNMIPLKMAGAAYIEGGD